VQSTVKVESVNVQIPVQNGPIRSEPDRGVTHARNAYFLTYRLADLGCSSNIGTSLWAKYPSGQSQWPKISVVNGQTAEKSRSKFWPAVAAVTMESIMACFQCQNSNFHTQFWWGRLETLWGRSVTWWGRSVTWWGRPVTLWGRSEV